MPAEQPIEGLSNIMFRMVIKTLTNNIFRVDICDHMLKMHEYTLIIVPRLVIFTSEH